MRERSDRKAERFEQDILEIPELKNRIDVLDKQSQTQVSSFLKQLGKSEPDPTRKKELADALIRAYEYRQFHDLITEIDAASEDPVQLELLLGHLYDWKVLESRAILEIVKGRIDIIHKFHSMIVNDAPETASSKSPDNLHDLVARYPWLLNPDWQVLAEEKTISRQLREWYEEDVPQDTPGAKLRYDFLALTDDSVIVIIDIKRSGHSLEFDELARLEKYKQLLSSGNDKTLKMVMICNDTGNVNKDTVQNLERSTRR